LDKEKNKTNKEITQSVCQLSRFCWPG